MSHIPSFLAITPERQNIIDAITSLYSGSASKHDMEVYTKNAIYDDPMSYCDDRFMNFVL